MWTWSLIGWTLGLAGADTEAAARFVQTQPPPAERRSRAWIPRRYHRYHPGPYYYYPQPYFHPYGWHRPRFHFGHRPFFFHPPRFHHRPFYHRPFRPDGFHHPRGFRR